MVKYRFERDPESQAPIWVEYETGADGKPQAVLPGAEQVTQADLAQRRANAPLRPAKPQKACDVGLFSDEANQLDLVEMFQDYPDE